MNRRRLPVLPAMRCDDGCGACCGPVPVTARELGQIRKYIKDQNVQLSPLALMASPLQCPLYNGKHCTIYPVRPLLCRVFGHTPRLTCIHGYNQNISDDAIRTAVKQNGKAVGLLGALLAQDVLP